VFWAIYLGVAGFGYDLKIEWYLHQSWRSHLRVIIRVFNYQTFASCCWIQLVISRYEGHRRQTISCIIRKKIDLAREQAQRGELLNADDVLAQLRDKVKKARKVIA
jgi:hypothetical protein